MSNLLFSLVEIPRQVTLLTDSTNSLFGPLLSKANGAGSGADVFKGETV
jgi:hypothetical protein